MSQAILSFFLWLSTLLGFTVVPCATPLTYSVVNVDARFDLSWEEFIAAIAEAEAVWEKPSGKDLFAYAPEKGKISVNLVYDYRQEATERLSSISTALTAGQQQYADMEKDYVALKARYASLRRAYEEAVASFNAANEEYAADVARWNTGPRTSKREFEALEAERVLVESKQAIAEARQTELNAAVKQLNAAAEKLNALAKTLNLDVKQYNAVGASRGEEFAGGLYTQEGRRRDITIYEFQNHEKLVRVLAHELGHALGLEHVADVEAIMHEVNEGTGTKATVGDVAALTALCKVQ